MPRQPVRAAPPPPVQPLDNASYSSARTSSLSKNNNSNLSTAFSSANNNKKIEIPSLFKATVIRPTSTTTTKKKKAPPPRPAPPKKYQVKPDLLDHLNFEHERQDLLEKELPFSAPPKKFSGISLKKSSFPSSSSNGSKKKFAPHLPDAQVPSATLIDLSTPPKTSTTHPSLSVTCPPNKTLLDMDNPDVLPHVPLLDMARSLPPLLPPPPPPVALMNPLPCPTLLPSQSKSTTSLSAAATAFKSSQTFPTSQHHRPLPEEDASPFVKLHQSIASKVTEKKDPTKEVGISNLPQKSSQPPLSVGRASVSSNVSSDSLSHLSAKTNVLCPSKINLVASTYSSQNEKDNLFKAEYDFPGEEEGDLSFQVGDEIAFLHKINEDWWYGECKGRQGQFPANFVSPLGKRDSITSKNLPLPSSTKENSRKVVALYDFPGDEPGDLAFSAGAKITVLHDINQDWLFGELDGKQGQFPANFVEEFSPSSQISRRGSQEDQASPPLGVFVAQYDFPAEQPDDLELKVGDRVLVTECINQDWWRGMITPAGQSGIFPASFVTRLES